MKFIDFSSEFDSTIDKKLKYCLKRFLLIYMGILLLGCSKPPPLTPGPNEIDRSVFTGIPCKAPCWYGLEPGKSTENDVLLILPTLLFIDESTIQIYPRTIPDLNSEVWVNGKTITANCLFSKTQCLNIDIANEILKDIVIKLNYEIRFEEAVGYLGNPNYIGFERLSTDQIKCRVELVWSEKQIILFSINFGLTDANKYCAGAYSGDNSGTTFSDLEIAEIKYLSKAEITTSVIGNKEFVIFSGIMP